MAETPDILKKIVDYKRIELAAAMSAVPLAEIKARIADIEDQPRGFFRALADASESGSTPIIAEVKKGSPSKGMIRPDFDPVAIAGIYETNGATCLSVLTDQHFFYGHLRFLTLIREQVRLPLLRKDFFFDAIPDLRSEIGRGRRHSAYRRHARPVRDPAFYRFSPVNCLWMSCWRSTMRLNLQTALNTDCRLIGINNRSLHTFITDLATTERLADYVPADRLLVAESGITARGDILRLQRAGAKAFLIGESMMREDDIGMKLQELMGARRTDNP